MVAVFSVLSYSTSFSATFSVPRHQGGVSSFSRSLVPEHTLRSRSLNQRRQQRRQHGVVSCSDTMPFDAKAGEAVKKLLFAPVEGSDGSGVELASTTKITVVGVGNVGMACAQTILTQNLCNEIALVDVVADKLQGEMLDLQHSAAFLPRTKVCASTDYAVTANSNICIITAGARQREGESRLSLVGRNVGLLKSIVPQLVKYSPEATLLLVANPVDILSWAAWKISGLPCNRVIGSGTNLDSSRFRVLLGNAFDVNANHVHAHIIGEHGDSSVPVWSGVHVAGIPLVKYIEEHGIQTGSDLLEDIHKQVVSTAYEVIKLKGYTSWAIGYSVASLVKSLLGDYHSVLPVSVMAKGMHGIEDELYLSLPCVLGRTGVLSIVKQPLADSELEKLLKCAKGLIEIQNGLEM